MHRVALLANGLLGLMLGTLAWAEPPSVVRHSPDNLCGDHGTTADHQHRNRFAEVNRMSVSPDGNLLAVSVDVGKVVLWDLAMSGQPAGILDDLGRARAFVAFSSNGEKLLTAVKGSPAIIWETKPLKRSRTLATNLSTVTCASFSPDGRAAFVCGNDPWMLLWDLATDVHREVKIGRPITSMDIAADSQNSLTVHAGNEAILRSRRSFLPITRLIHDGGNVAAVAFSADGRRALTAGSANVQLWDLEFGDSPPQRIWPTERLEGHISHVIDVCFVPGGETALSASMDTRAIHWDLKTGKPLKVLEGHTRGVSNVAPLAAGHKAITAAFDGSIRLWDLQSGNELARAHYFTPDDEWLVITPQGFFDGPPGIEKYFDGTQVIPGMEWKRSGEAIRTEGLLSKLIRDISLTP